MSIMKWLFSPSGYMSTIYIIYLLLSKINMANLYECSSYMWNYYKTEYLCLLLIITNLIQFAIIKNNFVFCISFKRKE